MEPEANDRVDTVLVFVFHELQFLLADISSRGWSIPGGRIQDHETPESAVIRETYEETGALLDGIVEIGFYILTEKFGEVETARRIPVYIARADEIRPMPGGFESRGVTHVSLGELPGMYYMWDPLIEAVCNYAHAKALDLAWTL